MRKSIIILSLLIAINSISQLQIWRLIDKGKFLRTAYCKCSVCCGKWSKYNKTAYGYRPAAGRTIAIDPTVLKPRCWYIVELPDGSTYIARAEDTGRLIKGHRIDWFKQNHSEARHIKDSVKIYEVERI